MVILRTFAVVYLLPVLLVLALPDAAAVNFQLGLQYDKGMTVSNTHLDLVPAVPMPSNSSHNETDLHQTLASAVLSPSTSMKMPRNEDSVIMRHPFFFMILAVFIWGLCFYYFFRDFQTSGIPKAGKISRSAAHEQDLEHGNLDDDPFDRQTRRTLHSSPTAAAGKKSANPSSPATSTSKSKSTTAHDLNVVRSKNGTLRSRLPLDDDEEDALTISVDAHSRGQAHAAAGSTLSPSDPGSASELMHAVLTRLDVPEYSMEGYQNALRDNWLTTVEQLLALDDRDWKRLNLPESVVAELKRDLASLDN